MSRNADFEKSISELENIVAQLETAKQKIITLTEAEEENEQEL